MLDTITIVGFTTAAVLSIISMIRLRHVQRHTTNPNPYAKPLMAALGLMVVVCIIGLIYVTVTL